MGFLHRNGPHAGKFEVAGTIKSSTPKAILLDDGVKEQWLPRKAITLYEHRRDSLVDVVMPMWMAKDRGYVRS